MKKNWSYCAFIFILFFQITLDLASEDPTTSTPCHLVSDLILVHPASDKRAKLFQQLHSRLVACWAETGSTAPKSGPRGKSRDFLRSPVLQPPCSSAGKKWLLGCLQRSCTPRVCATGHGLGSGPSFFPFNCKHWVGLRFFRSQWAFASRRRRGGRE